MSIINNGSLNERTRIPAENVKSLYIDSSVNVKVIVKEMDDIVIRLHSEGNVFGKTSSSLSVKAQDNEVKIFAEGSTRGVVLDIEVPAETLEKLVVYSTKDVKIGKFVNVELLIVKASGNVEVAATVKELQINCIEGDIDVELEAYADVTLKLDNRNGSINVDTENVRSSTVSVDSKNGRSSNAPRLKGRYSISGYIMAQNGNACLR